MNELLRDKVCIITGVGKGFGKDLAISFAEQGAKLGLITRNEDDAKDIDSLLSKSKNRSDFFVMCGDVAESLSAHSLVTRTIKEFDNVDILINNAGMRLRKPFLDITRLEFEDIMKNNFFSMVELCQKVIPYMVKKKSGKIVNLTSVAGVLGLPDLSAYVSSKSAVNGFTKSLAVEFAQDNIQINAIAAGFSKTSYFNKFKENQDLYQFTLDRIPMQKWGESKDIVNAALFLSSPMSDYITGEILNVDGGWSAW